MTMILTTEGQSKYTEEIDLPYSSVAQSATAHSYTWHLLMHNSKWQRVDESDPTSVTMQEFVDDISAKLNSKKSELKELDAKINGLLTRPLISNRTP